MEHIDQVSKTDCNFDLDLCHTCAVCNFITNSTEHLEKHTTAMHHDTPPEFITKFSSESDDTRTKKANSLYTLTNVVDPTGVKFLKRERDNIPLHSDSKLKLEYIDDGRKVDSNDLKPIITELSNMQSNINDSFSEFRSSYVKTEVELDKMFNDINQSTVKQEILSSSLSTCQVKDEIMHCQSCSYSDVDFGKLKSHKFTHHPTEAAVIKNYVGETGFNIHDIRFFCIKETCFFSTTLCNVYEQHLLHCCSIHQTMTRIETERLKSTITFVLDFHDKFGLDTTSGFLDFISSFNKVYSSSIDQDSISEDLEYGRSSSKLSMNHSTLFSDVKFCPSCDDVKDNSEYWFSSVPDSVLLANKRNTCLNNEVARTENMGVPKEDKHNEQLIKTDPCVIEFPSSSKGELINIESSIDHLVSNNMELEIDIAGKPLYNNNLSFSEEMRKDKNKGKTTIHAQCDKCGKFFAQESKILMNLGIYNVEKGFECIECTESFNGNCITSLAHMRNQKEERRFKCSECGKDFNRKSELQVHMRIHTGEKPFKCKDCSRRFSKLCNLIVHMRVHTKEKPFKCNECDIGFNKKRQLKVHMKLHTGDKPFKCNECSKCFSQKGDLKVHMRVHTGEKPFKCKDCNKYFSRLCNLRVHMGVHAKEKPFKCDECGKGFCEKRHLIVHIRIHTGEKPFGCNECGKSFSTKSDLRVHMKVHTREKPFNCSECGKGFSRKCNLTVHMRLHTGEKPYKCNECGKDFSGKNGLTVHMNKHTGEKPFSCSECGKSFSRKYHLAVHMRLHIGEKPFSCSECGKSFSRKYHLAVHMRLHIGEKPFSCSECGKSFSRKYHLAVHMRLHTGEKPFSCSECGKSFSRKYHLAVHMRLHTGEKPFKCYECDRNFRQKCTLAVHMKLHTGAIQV